MNSIYKRLGVHVPEILLPVNGTDLKKWAVIACDQYTSQPDYWNSVKAEVGQSPSTLKLVFPEIYLKDDDKDTRINNINRVMEQYLNQGVLAAQGPGFILVERSTPHTASRKGLILAVDLECYDYAVGSQSLIRATEGTVLDRIPPRVKIRENAPIELPHIMVLIDDPNKSVIEGLYAVKDSLEKLYDFDLMQGGGHVKGWKVDDEESLSKVASALEKLKGDVSLKPLLFAVGDGNHSLASAKAHWENVKAGLSRKLDGQTCAANDGNKVIADVDGIDSSAVVPEHPARYALVEMVNVHDDGLVFEPIHRVVFGINRATIQEQLIDTAGRIHLDANITYFASKEAVDAAVEAAAGPLAANKRTVPHLIPFILGGSYGLLTVSNPVSGLEVGTLQSILDEFVKHKTESNTSRKAGDVDIEIDYIHGEQATTELGSKDGCIGFYLPTMSKHDLFRTVKRDGVLPRKTFSMGEAEEKRYYLECRRIR